MVASPLENVKEFGLVASVWTKMLLLVNMAGGKSDCFIKVPT